MLAKTVSGMEPLLLDELNALGALDAKVVTLSLIHI